MGNRDSTAEDKQGTVLASTAIMNAVLASASEAEIGALYKNKRKASLLLRHTSRCNHSILSIRHDIKGTFQCII
jgi:tetrahydromethanopterin S-methyltransferase subunit H